jgi:hypothetical protein
LKNDIVNGSIFYTRNFLKKYPLLQCKSFQCCLSFCRLPIEHISSVERGTNLNKQKNLWKAVSVISYCLKSSFLKFYRLDKNEKWFKSHAFQPFFFCLLRFVPFSTLEMCSMGKRQKDKQHWNDLHCNNGYFLRKFRV